MHLIYGEGSGSAPHQIFFSERPIIELRDSFTHTYRPPPPKSFNAPTFRNLNLQMHQLLFLVFLAPYYFLLTGSKNFFSGW